MQDQERTNAREDCQEGALIGEVRDLESGSSAPDDAFLIEEVIDHFDAVTHLNLGLFGHGKDGTNQLA